MKIRSGFVSNSSSASFCIKKEKVSKWQMFLIENHMNMYKDVLETNKEYRELDRWSVRADSNYIYFSTMMDNFPMIEYLTNIHINCDDIIVEED